MSNPAMAETEVQHVKGIKWGEEKAEAFQWQHQDKVPWPIYKVREIQGEKT